MLVSTVRMGCIGFLDDYRKLKYHNKGGAEGEIQNPPDRWASG